MRSVTIPLNKISTLLRDDCQSLTSDEQLNPLEEISRDGDFLPKKNDNFLRRWHILYCPA